MLNVTKSKVTKYHKVARQRCFCSEAGLRKIISRWYRDHWNKKKAVKLEMKACLSEINKLRATTDGNWPELFEELYANYSSSNLFRVMNFIEYCKFAAKANDKYLVALEEVQRIHSVVWYISMMTDDYIGLDEKLQELEKQKEFDTFLYSFGFF